MSLPWKDGRGGAVGGMPRTQGGLALLSRRSVSRPVRRGFWEAGRVKSGASSSQPRCAHPTVDRYWAAGLSRVASAHVLAVTAKLMKTITGSNRL